MLKYLAIHVKTGEEANVARFVQYVIEKHWQRNESEFLKGISVLHFCNVVTKGKRTTFGDQFAQLRGYIFVGFKEWSNELYHILKSVPGVIRLMDSWRDGSFTTQEEIDQMTSSAAFQLHMIIPDTPVAEAAVEEIKNFVAEAKEWFLERGKRMRKVLSMPFGLVKSLVERHAPEALNQHLDVTWYLRHLPGILYRENDYTPPDTVDSGHMRPCPVT